MFKGKAFCEAHIQLFSKKGDPEDRLLQRVKAISTYMSPTVRVTHVTTLQSKLDEYGNPMKSLSVRAEVLVKYDPYITHLNDYRVKACTILRDQLPRAGAIMAHSIDTYSPLREHGFTSGSR
ncbi:hypothetical protein [Halalkalibacter krulwichiae]|uniref:Uncharacterized protein n=1 Tax=Halalkalibacter krulwichiae TaxID=199441 RepID=A0A1X9MBW0_9BACI|nr:hypothetical protein [Halalkalibacter krulwichiae]ARK30888.1 hypothetical protein BkAM31D_14145 [Halalkalibacter krulwichiae]